MKEKDFGSIFQTNTYSKINERENVNGKIVNIPHIKCINWKYSDRNSFELGDIEALAEDIQNNGQIQPITVRAVDNGLYEVIAGERRWRACKLINREVQAIIIKKDDLSSFLTQISENNRHDISPYSKAMSYSKIIDDGLVTQNMLAKKLGYKTSTFSELMSYSYIPKNVWDAIDNVSNVSIATACFMRKLINEDKNNVDKLITIAKDIEKGAGKRKIEALLLKKSSVTIKPTLFIAKSNNLKISNEVLSKIPMETIIDHLDKLYKSVRSSEQNDSDE